MNFLELAEKRYSVRDYADKNVEEEKLKKILAAAHAAPTAANLQPVRLLVLQTKEQLAKLEKSANIYHAPLAIVVCSDTEKAWTRPYDGKQTTVLGAFDTTIRIATDDEKKIVYNKLGSYKNQVYQIYAVSNENTNKKFDAWKGNSAHTDLLWHGSRTENWLSITATGLCLKPNAITTGHMFGYGIYFAPSPSKSAGYTDKLGSRWANGHGGRAFLGLFEVHTGKSYMAKDHTYE